MIIETHDLSKRFLRHEAVKGLSLSVPEGSAMALIGANGAGKTTTIRMLMNIIRPGSGSATVLGVDSRKVGPKEYARIGYVSENQKLPGALTVAEYFRYLRTLYPTWDTELEASLLKQLDLPPNRKIGKLYHGMRMKAALAAALPFRPSLLVLDEPLSGLDPLVRDEVMESILQQAGEMTILISSHELAEIEGTATDVAFVANGRLVFQESMETLYGRFREVTVTVGDGARPLLDPPANWINPQSAGPLISFIDTNFTTDAALARALNERLGAVVRVDARAMPLRVISKAMMREIRKEAA